MPSNLLGPLIVRGVSGFFSDIFTYLAYNYTSFSKTQAIFFTNTLMIPFFALCILKEPLRKQDIIAIIISFVGMILIIQPFKTDSLESVEGESFWDSFKYELVGIVFALLGAVSGALAIIFNRKVSQELHFTVVAFWYVSSNVLLCPIWSIIQ